MQNESFSTRKATLNFSHQFSIHKNKISLADPHYSQNLHWHDFFELEMVLEGEAVHVLNGVSYHVQPGSLYLLTPADLHTLIATPNADPNAELTVLNLSFLNSIVSDTSFTEVQTLPPPLTATAKDKDFDDLLYLMQMMFEAKWKRGPYTDDVLRHLFLSFIFRFLRLYRLQSNTEKQADMEIHGNRELMYIQNAIAYIRYNFRDPDISIKKIAAEVCLSSNYFGIIFKKHMGETCLSYLKKQRMNFANALLQNSNLTIAEIAEKCGYSNVPYFISDFRNTYGMPPRKHRDAGKK